MRWKVAWGAHEKGLREVQATGATVNCLETKPVVPDEFAHLWAAFADLQWSRPAGFGPCPIPLTEIEAWLRLHGIDDADGRQEYVTVLRAMDAAWLDEMDKKDQATRPLKR